MAEAPIDFNSLGPQIVVTKIDDWVKTIIMDNIRIVPKKCRPYLKRALHTGFIEDVPRFEKAFDILLTLLRQRVLGNISPEDRQAAREAERRQELQQEVPLAPDHETGARALVPESESLDDLCEIPDPLVMEPLLDTLFQEEEEIKKTVDYSVEDLSVEPLTLEDRQVSEELVTSVVEVEDSVIEDSAVLEKNVLNDSVNLNYFELVENEHSYNEIVINFVNNMPVQVLVTTQSTGTIAAEPVTSPPRDPIESLPMEQPVLSVRPKEHLKKEAAAEIGEEKTDNYQYIVRPKDSKFRHSASAKSVDRYKSKSDRVRKVNSNGKGDDKHIDYNLMDDGKKPIKQLRKEAAEKKKVLQEREKPAKTVEPQVKLKTVNPSNGIAELSVTGSEKISIITDGTSDQEKMKITVEVTQSEIQIVIQKVQGQWGN